MVLSHSFYPVTKFETLMSKTYLHLKMLDHLASKVNSLTVGHIMRAINLKFLHQKYKSKTDLLILIASIASMKFAQ